MLEVIVSFDTQAQYDLFHIIVGAVELPLTCAQVSDPDNIGLEYWISGSPNNDPRSDFCERRLRCYALVLDSLTVFEDRSNNAKASAAAGSGNVPLDDPEAVRVHAYELAFLSEDEVFHSTLYDWLIDRDLADELLEVRSFSDFFLAFESDPHRDILLFDGSIDASRVP